MMKTGLLAICSIFEQIEELPLMAGDLIQISIKYVVD